MPPDVDIGVIYSGERDLMPRLLNTMSASGGGFACGSFCLTIIRPTA